MAYVTPAVLSTGALVAASADWNVLVNDIRYMATDGPRAKASVTIAQSIVTSTLVPVIWNTVDYDNASILNLGSFPTRLTAPVTGLYEFSYSLSPDRGGSIYNGLSIAKIGGAAVESCRQSTLCAVSLDNGVSAAVPLRLTAAQYVEVQWAHNYAGNRDLVAAGQYAALRWLGT